MRVRSLSPLLLRTARPPLLYGLLAAALGVTLETLVIYPLAHVANVVSLGVVYLIAVVVVSTYWGVWLGFATAVASAFAFNFFHLPPVGHFTLADSRNWVALGAFTAAAAVVSTIAELARTRALEAERGRREADLAASLARELLAGSETRTALGVTAHRVAEALALPSAAIARLQPDVHCKGSDYAPPGGKPIPEAEIVRGYGGRIEFLPLVEAVSTTDLIRRIQQS